MAPTPAPTPAPTFPEEPFSEDRTCDHIDFEVGSEEPVRLLRRGLNANGGNLHHYRILKRKSDSPCAPKRVGDSVV